MLIIIQSPTPHLTISNDVEWLILVRGLDLRLARIRLRCAFPGS